MSKGKMVVTAAGLATAFTAASANANIEKWISGGGGEINDLAPLVSEVVFEEDMEIKDVKSFHLLGLNHTWAGDLIVTIEHVDTGTSVEIMHRIGASTGGSFDFGDSSDFSGDYWFADGGADIWAAAAADPIPMDTYQPSGMFNVPTSLAAFVGESTLGTWRLTVTDVNGGDSGSLTGWELYVNAVPAPGSVALFGLAGLAAGRRRR